jgi:aspartate aminotransferase
MPKISSKGSRMPESPIRKLVPFAEAAKKRGTNVIHLNIGQPDIKTPEVAVEAVKNFDLKVLEYTHSAGFESYREGLSKYYSKHNIEVSKDEMIITTGGSEAISFALGSIMDSGDEVIIPEPFYANYNGFATANNVNVVPVVSTIDTGFALPEISAFEELITENTKAIMICNPGNPTGYLYSKEELESLKQIVLKHDLFLIADEVYREFTYDGEKHMSLLELEGVDENVIVIDSVSKRYSMCGARIGAMISKNKTVMSTAMKFAQARLSPPTYAQIASEAALNTPDSYFDEVIEEYVDRRNILIDNLRNIDGVKVPNPKGAFYVVVELPIDDADIFAQWLLEEFSYKGSTVMVAPATGFYSTPGLGKKQVRIAYVLKKEDLVLATEILNEALKVYPGRD